MRIYAVTRRNRRATKSGKFPPKNPARLSRSGLTAHDHSPSSLIARAGTPRQLPPSLIARAGTSRRLTPHRIQPQQQQEPFRLPEKAASKDAPTVASHRERNNPHPIPFRRRNWAPSPLQSRGSKAGPPRVSTATLGQQSQGQLWASPYMAEARASDRSGCPKSCPRSAGRSPNGIPP